MGRWVSFFRNRQLKNILEKKKVFAFNERVTYRVGLNVTRCEGEKVTRCLQRLHSSVEARSLHKYLTEFVEESLRV